ncbi:MAG: type II secretion system protein [Candidatus Omnitrophica bacterium]|nr:type II secretion system protein [Candidatus Omnitrophota bacterium]
MMDLSKNRHGGAACQAFTLVELLVAASIFSIIALCLYSVFAGGISVWTRQEKAFKYNHSARLALDSMARELRGAINYSQVGGAGQTAARAAAQISGDAEALRFTGDEGGFSFITVIGEDIAKVRYVFEAAPEGRGVIRRGVALQKEGFKTESEKEKNYIERLTGAFFEYAYKKEAGADGAGFVWEKSWQKEDVTDVSKIPAGLRITLEFQEQGKKEKDILRKTVFIPTGSLEEYKG